MKKLLLSLFILVLGISFFASAMTVDVENARLAGKNFYFERINSRTQVPYQDLSITGEIVEKDGTVPIYYIFNFNEKGFIIVSGEDACTPILGYSFETSFDPANLPDALRSLLDKFKREILYVRQNNFPPDEAITSSWQRLSVNDPSQLKVLRGVTEVLPLISNNWNQDFPYNALCPEDAAAGGSYNGRVPVGCTATSMTQIMYYWRYPLQGQGYHCDIHTQPYGPQCANFGTTYYEWDGMAEQPNKETNPLAILSWHGGISVNMDYAPDGSGAQCSQVPTALKNYFKYASSAYFQNRPAGSSTTWKNTMKADLDNSLPLQYSGFGPGAGHAFVCDGYQANDYFHFNFGWAGQGNGYYTIDNINPSGSTFNDDQGAVFQIKPNPAYYPYSCNGNVNETTYNFGTFEDGSGPVSEYQNNLNCSWILGADDSVSTVTLSFVRFNTLAGDEVKVYDGVDASAPLLATFSGSAVPSSVASTGNKMFVTFITDGSGTAPGWLASYQEQEIPFCDNLTVLEDYTGSFTDGSERFEYRNSTNCKWKIQPPNAASLTVSFSYFNSEETADKLQVYDLGLGTLLATYSGNYTAPPAPITSSTGKMMLIWNSDKTIRGEGWAASYTTIVGTEEKELFNGLSIFPNPGSDLVNLSFTIGEPQNIRLELLSMTGKTVFTENLQYFKGDYTRAIDVSSLAKGLYTLRLTGDTSTSTRKIIVQ